MWQLSLVTTCHTCAGSHLSDEQADEKWHTIVVRQNNNDPIQKLLLLVTCSLIRTQHSSHSEIYNTTLPKTPKDQHSNVCFDTVSKEVESMHSELWTKKKGKNKKIYIIPETKAYKNVGALTVVHLITLYSHTNPWHLWIQPHQLI